MKFLKSLKLSFKIGVLIAIAIILASASVAFFSTKIVYNHDGFISFPEVRLWREL